MKFKNIQICVPGPPGPPKNPQITDILKESCLISWEEPGEDGGAPITGYYVERRLTSSKRWIRITKEALKDMKYQDENIIEDNEYEYRVMAENKAGIGAPSKPSAPVLAKDPWSKYTLNGYMITLQ